MESPKSQADIIVDAEGLLEALTDYPGLQPSIEDERQELEQSLEEVKDLKAKQQAFNGQRQEATQLLSKALDRLRDAAIRVRAVVKVQARAAAAAASPAQATCNPPRATSRRTATPRAIPTARKAMAPRRAPEAAARVGRRFAPATTMTSSQNDCARPPKRKPIRSSKSGSGRNTTITRRRRADRLEVCS